MLPKCCWIDVKATAAHGKINIERIKPVIHFLSIITYTQTISNPFNEPLNIVNELILHRDLSYVIPL